MRLGVKRAAFSVAYAHEALARAAAVDGDLGTYAEHDTAARALLEADLAILPDHPERSNG